MKDGFIRTACAVPDLKVADPVYNGERIRALMRAAAEDGCRITVFPELCVTGYTCGDLFLQETLLRAAEEETARCAALTEELPGIYLIGTPVSFRGKLYNCAAVLSGGRILGLVPKTSIPEYHEFYERRQFTPGMRAPEEILYADQHTKIGTDLLFRADTMKDLVLAAEICEDLWVPDPPSVRHALAGATVVANLSASNAVTGKAAYRRSLVSGQSARLYCAYLYACAGPGESTQDIVFAGESIIAESGRIRAENRPYQTGFISSEVDLGAVMSYRRQMSTFLPGARGEEIMFHLDREETRLTCPVDPMPFVPHDDAKREERCREILDIQAHGLAKRLLHTGCRRAVLGISGGLDSTLALLVTARAFDIAGLPRKGILAVTMPGFGTTDRTYRNALTLIREVGAEGREIPIADAVTGHFQDIGQDMAVHDVTYENSQARERTQILMDLANKEQGLVIGTGDLSELALGWATYNGDHMSMYAVNASVPKTLVRYLVRFEADRGGGKLSEVLLDILDTPVSPELLPPENGEISQKTEDLVGPYELHDFFLYYVQRFGFSPSKIMRLARIAFTGRYEDAVIKKWLVTFYRRFFSQQFKRSCLPDGPKVGTVALSPRGDLRMPSDASAALWIREAEEL